MLCKKIWFPILKKTSLHHSSSFSEKYLYHHICNASKEWRYEHAQTPNNTYKVKWMCKNHRFLEKELLKLPYVNREYACFLGKLPLKSHDHFKQNSSIGSISFVIVSSLRVKCVKVINKVSIIHLRQWHLGTLH